MAMSGTTPPRLRALREFNWLSVGWSEHSNSMFPQLIGYFRSILEILKLTRYHFPDVSRYSNETRTTLPRASER